MKKKYSLKGRDLFKEVNIKGRKYYGASLRLSVMKRKPQSEDSGPSMNQGVNVNIGITVPKRFGNAVKRNSAKRRLRAVCREVIPMIKNGTLIIIRIEDKMKQTGINELKNELKLLIKKSGAAENESVF